ncbi:MMPL family transporter [Micromonospora sp. DT231]|uniref:MMPL family transporter n=1 Tax=Micromonospora sp. DT231 TaxID=3416526 RepID=UPI003CE8731F
MKPDNISTRIARVSARHPVLAILVWVLVIGACVGASAATGMRSATSAELAVGDAGQAARLMQEAGLEEPATEYVLIAGGAAADRTSAATRVTAELGGIADVAAVAGAVPSQQRTDLLMVPVVLRGDPQTAYERVESTRSAVERVAKEFPALSVEQTGSASISAGLNEQLANDFASAEILSIPVTLLVLLLVFGAFVAAVIPLVLALTFVAGSVGLSALVSHLIPDSGTTSNVILLVGMAVGVDYSLFYVKREREERHARPDGGDSVEIAAATSGHAVVFSGIAVIVSMCGLYLVGDPSFNSLASAAVIVVAVAVGGSLTVLPALLVILRRVLDRPRVPFIWRITNKRTEAAPRLWPAVLKPSLRRPLSTLIVVTLGLIALGLPGLQLSLAAQRVEDLPAGIPAVAAYEKLSAGFPSVGAQFEVVVRTAGRADWVADGLRGLAEKARTAGLVSGDDAVSEVRTSADGRTSVIALTVNHADGSTAARDALTALRGRYVPALTAQHDGVTAVVGGQTAADHDYDRNMQDKLPMVVGFVLLFSLIVMAITFRSLVIGVVTLVMNLMSTAAAFGVLVLVFQNSWADSLLDYRSTGTIISWVPLFLFVILVGLSMDYHVFVLHRVYEEARNRVPLRDAVVTGIVHSAGVVTAAALAMAAVFSVFATLSFNEFKQLAIGLGVAVLLDAFVIRAFLLPSTLLVLGRAAWWPGPLSRRRNDTGVPPLAPAADTADEPAPVST